MTLDRWPLSDGDFPTGGVGVTAWTETLGFLEVGSQGLLLGDPFLGLRKRGNTGVPIHPGRYRVALTLLRQTTDPETPDTPNAIAFVSLVISETLLARRVAWQRRRVAGGSDGQLPAEALVVASDEVDPAEKGGGEEGTIQARIDSESGCVALVDLESFERRMPEDDHTPGQSWYDTLFEHGIAGSWFDQVDAQGPIRTGAAMIELPKRVSVGPVETSVSGGTADMGERETLSHEAFLAVVHGDGAGAAYPWFWELAFYDAVWAEDEQNDNALDIESIERLSPPVALHIQLRA